MYYTGIIYLYSILMKHTLRGLDRQLMCGLTHILRGQNSAVEAAGEGPHWALC